MYDNLIGVAVTNVYVGVVMTTTQVPDEVYRVIAGWPHDRVSSWYFDMAGAPGALWIAEAGKHAEPVLGWLDDTQQHIDGPGMLAAVIDNGASRPTGNPYTFTVSRRTLDRRAMQRLINHRFYTMYLPHADEFRFLVEDKDDWIAISRSLDARPSGAVLLIRRRDIPEGHHTTRRKSTGYRYDPIMSQIQEIMVPITQLTINVAGTLRRTWDKVWPPVPEDVDDLLEEIAEEEERINAQRQHAVGVSAERDVVLGMMDRYAYRLSQIRRMAATLELGLLDLEPSSRPPMGYAQVATPMMLRAVAAYAGEIANCLGISGFAWIPIVGEKFAVRTKLFPDLREAREEDEQYTRVAALVEIPAETRLRLGALPMIAREIAWLLDDDLDRLCNEMLDLRQSDEWVSRLLPSMHDVAVGREVAADLIATAVAGPPYVFAMSRFAVGTLSQSEGARNGHRLPLRQRINACLALLRALDIPTDFSSVYLHEHAVRLPPSLPGMVRDILAANGCRPVGDVSLLIEQLNRGIVVKASPREVLAALWQACATGGPYVNEQAALVAVAASHEPEAT